MSCQTICPKLRQQKRNSLTEVTLLNSNAPSESEKRRFAGGAHSMNLAAFKVRECGVIKKPRDGAPGRTRTCNPLVRSQVFYPVELRVLGLQWCLSALLTASFDSSESTDWV